MEDHKTYIVLYKNNARLASVYNTQDNLNYLKSMFYLSPIQTDITGTQHYNVLAVKKTKKTIKANWEKATPIQRKDFFDWIHRGMLYPLG